jgi:hypothetical protein
MRKKSNNVEGRFKKIPLQWFFTNDSTTTNMPFNDKCEHHGSQITMVCLDMLTIYLKGQMLNSRIWIRCPIHLDVFMFTFKQGLENPKAICREAESLFQIHVV